MAARDDQDDDSGSVIMAVRRAEGAELRRGMAEVRSDIDRIEERVDVHTEHIGDLRESHARIDGEVRHLVRAYERAATVATAQVMTDLDVRKADALAEIKERGAEGEHKRSIRRELAFKLITVLMGLWAIVSSMLAARC